MHNYRSLALPSGSQGHKTGRVTGETLLATWMFMGPSSYQYL